MDVAYKTSDMTRRQTKGFSAIAAAAAAMIAFYSIGSEARALDGPAEWGASRGAAQDGRNTDARDDVGAQKGRVFNAAPSGVARSHLVLKHSNALPALGENIRARAAAAPKASTSIEKGVRVVRGAPAQRLIVASLDQELKGASSVEKPVRAQKVVVYRECVRPRRLTTHGFFSGLRRYNKPLGGFATDTFGFNNGYRRTAPRSCRIAR